MIDLAPQPCLIDWGLASHLDGEPLRWRALHGPVTRWRRRLAACRLPHGSRIALRAKPGSEAAAILQAAALTGLALALIDARRSRAEQQEQLAACEAVLLIHDHGPELEHGRRRALEAEWPGTDHLPPLLTADDEALLLPTSGSGGAPRIVVHSLASLLHAAQASCQHLGLTPRDRWACPLPLDHIGGLMCVWRSALSGARLRLCNSRELPADLVGCSGASLVPTMLDRCLADGQACPAGLERVLIGGATARASLIAEAVERGYRPLLSYGCSETAGMACAQRPDECGQPHCGQPLPGIDLRLEGERVLLRGPQCFRRYLDQEARPSEDWFDTGDLARLDQRGRLVVIGRGDRRIVSGGENVDPQAVEELLCRHPAVRAALVVGLPDETWGEVVAAALVGDGVDEETFAAWLRRHCSPASRPKRWLWLDELPRGRLDKPDHRALAARFTPAG